MGASSKATTGAKAKCRDCGKEWIEGKVYLKTFVVLRDIEKKDDFYTSLDSSIVSHEGSSDGMKSVWCCPSCEPTMWELRIHTARKAFSKSKKRQKELAKKLACNLYARLLYGGKIELDYPEGNILLSFDIWGSFVVTHLEPNKSILSKQYIPMGQARMWVNNIVNEMVKDGEENENRIERAVNMTTLLKKLSIHGELD